MRQNIKQQKSEGFTIIEVMIVLAIAGLIMLIVFLAVPALQRNSRNTTAKNDAAAVAAAISEFQSNNDGQLPTGVAGTGTVAVTGAAGTSAASGKVQGSTTVSVVTAVPASVTAGTVQVYLKYDCNAGAVNNRATSVYYLSEGTTNTVKCLAN